MHIIVNKLLGALGNLQPIYIVGRVPFDDF